MLRELRSYVTLLRELRIVNQSYSEWPSDSNPEFETKLRNMRILPMAWTFCPSILFNTNRLWKEQPLRVVAALVEGKSLLHIPNDGSGAKHRHGTAVGLG
jgi:hypothetical protein